MASTSPRSYKDAVTLLNSLQTNAAVLATIRADPTKSVRFGLPEMLAYVERAGYQVDDLNRLGLIHITGTKGKGSTAALAESALRSVGRRGDGLTIKTGLYTSPHLMEVRERIRIDGAPLSRDKFALYFFELWDRLKASEARYISEAVAVGMIPMPNYFRFLTILAFHVFMREETNATLLEVGIGGQHDSTNIITGPVVTGIASLGYDHVAILGSTLTEIGRQKAGIMKRGAPCVVAPQPAEGMRALVDYGREIGSPVVLAAPLPDTAVVGLAGAHQRVNAALAASLALVYLHRTADTTTASSLMLPTRALAIGADADYRALAAQYMGTAAAAAMGADARVDARAERDEAATYASVDTAVPEAVALPMVPAVAHGIAEARWPGRAHVVRGAPRDGVDVYADGAHTTESLRACARWFAAETTTSSSTTARRHLVFNLTHARDAAALLAPLAPHPWDSVTFCPAVPGGPPRPDAGGDTTNYTEFADPELKQQQALRDAWAAMVGPEAAAASHVRPSVHDALAVIASSDGGEENTHAVLVTGSLYLVGALLEAVGAPVE
ncbi:Mur ligase [Blastocladiella britannica]|nr:Mur ligase [Blastocladiella britannica]